MILHETKGNLFEVDERYVLVHCISLDCAMGAGIAIQFNKRYKGLKPSLLKVIKDRELNYPITIPYFIGKELKVFNLVTKDRYFNKPTYTTITKCIEQMAIMCRKCEIKFLAMPQIGCGLDRLSWAKVKDIIVDKFKDLDITIEVRYL